MATRMNITRQRAGSTAVAAPVGGLNDKDPLASMPPQDAVILDNWWVLPSSLEVRRGSLVWASGMPGVVETIAEYAPSGGIDKLFAISSGGIYDITGGGVVGAPLVSGLSNSRWESTNISTAGGSFMYLFNGIDSPLLYDGVNFTQITGSSTPAITGVSTNLLSQGVVFKSRLYMVERDSCRVWYLPVTSIAGAALSFDLGAVFQRGGHIVGMYTWTIDAGNGADDHAIFISSNGEVVVYQGSDPSSANGWSMIGLFYLGSPIGIRGAAKYGGDLVIATSAGILPLSRGLLTASISKSEALTDKVQNIVSNAVGQHRNNFGWEICVYPDENALILNVPAGAGNNYQLVQNSITGAWTKFSGWNATTIVNTGDGLFYGENGKVRKAWVGNTDDGQMIVADALQSFQTFGRPAANKYFTMVNPFIQTTGHPSVLYAINGDYIPKEPSGALVFAPPTGMIWSFMAWGTMAWGGSLAQYDQWATVGNIYRSAAIRLKVQSNAAEVQWAATNFVYEYGGLL